MKRFIPLLLLAVAATVGLAGTPQASYAAEGADCSTFTPKQAMRVAGRSGAVFEGQVTLPKQVNPDKPLKLSVQVLAAWTTGVAVPSQTTVTLRPGACRDWMLAHPSPEDYLFFASKGATSAWVIPGDAPRMVARTSKVVAALGAPVAGSQLSPTPPPVPVTFIDRHAAPARSLMKVAAPGVALLIVGLLGFLVVGRLARRY